MSIFAAKLATLAALCLQVGFAAGATRPNVVFILADDQDKRLGSLDYLPNAHNHNVTDVTPPYGGYPKFVDQGLNNNWLPVWLQDAGYNNYYVGKLFNSHSILNYWAPFPKGFEGSEFILDPYQYQYWDPTFQRNWEVPKKYDGAYTTDLVADKALAFLDDAVDAAKPFFLTIAPIAPHVEVNVTIDVLTLSYTLSNGPPIPATRHLGLFPNVTVPRTKNFNPDTPSGASWVSQLPQLNATEVAGVDEFYRNRLRALQAVDELVGRVFAALEARGVLDDTYVFYSSDNGYHVGQHRLRPGKKCAYEEDINVPLIVRGPGVPEGAVADFPTTHTDLAPTFLDILGVPPRADFDGAPIPLTAQGLAAAGSAAGGTREHVQVEFWNRDNPSEWGGLDSAAGWNNTYKALRIIGEGYDLFYSVWCTNEHELYDMSVDPDQLDNLFPAGFSGSGTSGPAPQAASLGVSASVLASRLDALLFVLKSCKGEVCRSPWASLLPGAGVSSLKDALQAQYDSFFLTQVPRVSFSACLAGYIISAEGPQFAGPTLRLARRDGIPDGSDPAWALMT